MHTWGSATNSSFNSIGVVTGVDSSGDLEWRVSSSSIPSLRPGPNLISVTVRGNKLLVWVDGFKVCSTTLTLPKNVYIGFTGGTGESTDTHAVSNIQIAAGG
jgi:hypothetical protein